MYYLEIHIRVDAKYTPIYKRQLLLIEGTKGTYYNYNSEFKYLVSDAVLAFSCRKSSKNHSSKKKKI